MSRQKKPGSALEARLLAVAGAVEKAVAPARAVVALAARAGAIDDAGKEVADVERNVLADWRQPKRTAPYYLEACLKQVEVADKLEAARTEKYPVNIAFINVPAPVYQTVELDEKGQPVIDAVVVEKAS